MQPRIQMPNQVAIEINGQEGPWASPVTVVMPMQGGIKVLASGGLMKEEVVAAHIYANIAQGMDASEDFRDLRRAAAELALIFAEDLLAVSAERRKAKAEGAGPAEQEHDGRATQDDEQEPIIVP